jgi:hypothetical protein
MSRVDPSGKCSDVNIIETENTPIMQVLLCPATSLSNFVTTNRAYSLFLYETFIQNRSYLLRYVERITCSDWLDMESAGLEILHLKPEDAQYQKPKP